MYQKILSYVNQHHMLTQGDGIVAGVSGGADSVCLLFVLRKMVQERGGALYVAHVNHGLRGKDALLDQEFVRSLCEKWGLPFYLKSVDLKQIAREKKLSEEEAGRLVRYDFFRQVAEETGAAKIAVGHNANDNAETFLFHLMRGSSLRGLCGISPVQGQIIRPLLCLRREEIEAFDRENDLSYCMDKTNLEDTYTRNRIRHSILPLMEEINPEAVDAIGRAAAACSRNADLLQKETEKALASFVKEEAGETLLRKEAFDMLPAAVLEELLMETLCRVAGSRKDIGAIHIEALRALQAGETGKSVNLPYAVQAGNCYGNLTLKKAEKPAPSGAGKWETPAAFGEIPLSGAGTEGEIPLPDGATLHYSIEKYEKNVKIPKNRYTKWLNYDIINGTLRIRTRKPGDRIQVLAGGGTKKFKDYLIDEKVVRSERNRVVLLALGDEILWAVGYRLSERVKITEATTHILKLTYIGGDIDGEREEYSDTYFRRGCGESDSGTGEPD